MSVPGSPAEGMKTVGQVTATNALRFRPDQSAMEIAIKLSESHMSGGPVVDTEGKYLGFISEFDMLHALRDGKDLNTSTADAIMNRKRFVAEASTTIDEAIDLMERNHLLSLPVEKNGAVAYTVTRHDLMRARLGIGPAGEE